MIYQNIKKMMKFRWIYRYNNFSLKNNKYYNLQKIKKIKITRFMQTIILQKLNK